MLRVGQWLLLGLTGGIGGLHTCWGLTLICRALLQLLSFSCKLFNLLPSLKKILTHFVDFPLVFFAILFRFSNCFYLRLCLSHPSLHFLHKLSQLSVFFVFLLKHAKDFLVFYLHLLNNHVSLLEFLLDDLKLLRIRESIFWLDDLLELFSKSNAFIHVHLDFNLCFMSPRILYVPLQKFNLVSTSVKLKLLVTYFPFQINHKVVRICLAALWAKLVGSS